MKLQRKSRPKFAGWRYERGLALRQTADLLANIAGYRICSHERVRTLCLPFDDEAYSPPDAPLLKAIEELTEREIGVADFPPPVRQWA